MDKIAHYKNLITNEEYQLEKYKRNLPVEAIAILNINCDMWTRPSGDTYIHSKMLEIIGQNIADNLLNTYMGRSYLDDIKTSTRLRTMASAMRRLFRDNDPEGAFEIFREIEMPYAVTAYLMFIYDHTQYMPLRMSMNCALKELGYTTLETHYSYRNYLAYMDNLRTLASKLGKNKTLFDAHDFLWIIRTRIINEQKKAK